MEPRFNEVSGDRPNLFVKWRVRYIEVLFHTFYCNFGRDIEITSFVISRTSLNRGSLNRGSTVRYLQRGLGSAADNDPSVLGFKGKANLLLISLPVRFPQTAQS